MAIRVILRLAAIFLLSFQFVGLRAQQTHFDPGFSWRGYDGCDADRLCHFYPTNAFESAFQEFAAWRSTNNTANTAESFMNFRVAFPLGYDKNRVEPYPIIIMLHGAGESGRIWQGNFNYATSNVLYDNNSRNLLHGGNVHQQAANRVATNNPLAFPGIIIFPQVSYSGSWSSGYDNGVSTTNQEYVYEFLDYIVANYKGDINRIYMHGLSNGARGTWDTATKRPDLFAAILPMSGIPYDLDSAAVALQTTPIRLYQGGLDTNPSPGGAKAMLDKLVALGGNPQYILYPTLGHGTWNTAYGEPDFWSWMLTKDKRNTYVYGGSTDLCANVGATKKLGFSDGFSAYRWKKDGNIINGETTRFLTIIGTGNYTGSYTVEFQRPGDLTGTWYSSFPVTISAPSGGGLVPALTVQGSLILPYTIENGTYLSNSLGQTETRLYGPTGYSQYRWYKNGGIIQTNSSYNVKITHGKEAGNGGSNFNGQGNQANVGNWQVQVLEASGCWSNLSNILTLVYNPGSLAPCTTCHSSPPTGAVSNNFFTGVTQVVATPQTEKSMLITWTDNCPNEGYFEIWRLRRADGTFYQQQDYKVIARVPSNTTSYLDSDGLRPQAQYRYSIRAVSGNEARFSNITTSNPYPTTYPDTKEPSTPTGLNITNITETTVSILWNGSNDNDVIHRYEVFNGSTMVASLTNDISGDLTDGSPVPPTEYTFTGLEPGTTYLLNVRAKDFRNNYSAFPQALVATTSGSTNGLSYKYYTTAGLSGNNTVNANQLAEPYTTVNGPNFNFSTSISAQVGVVSNFSNGITLAETIQGNTDPNNFVLAFNGYIQIDVQRNYRFFTSSDDGSRLYINGNLMVNNDGAQGTTNVGSNIINLPVGKHAIRVTFFDNTGGNVLGVKYSWDPTNPNGTPTTDYNNANAIFIPDSKLFLTNTTFTNYYSQASGDLNLLSTWGTNLDGSGTIPSSFENTNYQIFTIKNRSTVSLSNPWEVSGIGSRVVVDNNVVLSLDEALTAKVYANAGSIINLNNSTLPQLVLLHASSTVNMNAEGDLPIAIYGNLNLNTASTTKTLPVSSTFVTGNIAIADEVTFKGAAFPNRSNLTVSGNISFNGNSGAPLSEDDRYSLSLDGNLPHIINVNQTDISLAGLDLEGTLSLQFNDSNPHTLEIGIPNSSSGLLLKSGSILELSNHHLVVNGVYGVNPTDDSGVINTIGGDITISTTSAQTSNLYFASTGNSIHDLSLSNIGSGQINMANTAELTNLMTIADGTVNMQGDFVLRSTSDDANGTARIGPLLNGAKISGNVTAQRYMSGEGRIYRYISSPVKGATVAQLQAAFPVTGNFTGTSTGDGLSAKASMFQYNEKLNPQYQQFPLVGGNNLDTLRRGKGYSPFIRNETTGTVWQVTGEPYQGNIPFVLTGGTGGNTGWNLIGNPYASPIKWTNGHSGGWAGSGVNAAARIRVNSNGTTQVITAGVDEWVDGIIAPGQAFWVQTTADDASLTIQEDAKVTTDGAFFRVGEEENKVKIIMRSSTLKDAAAIRFLNEASTAYDVTIDAIKLDNSYFNLSTLTSDNMPMALNNTTLNYCEQEVKLRITNAEAGSYSLDISGVAGLLSEDAVTFTDSFTQTEFEVTDALTYPFSITADAASKADGRFTLLFKKPEVTLNQSLKSYPACEADSPLILVTNSQPGVTYQAFYNDLPVSDAFMSVGGTLEIAANPTALAIGSTVVTLKAGFKGCTTYDLPMSVTVQRDQLETPTIIEESLRLTASTENAQYQWYFNGEIMEGQIKRELIAPVNGLYFVEVMLSACSKVSDTVSYVVTAIEKPNRANQLYPNPTRDKVTITLEQAIHYETVQVISSLGQVVSVPVSMISSESAEVDFSNLPVGLYVVQVNGYRYRVLKE